MLHLSNFNVQILIYYNNIVIQLKINMLDISFINN